MLGAGVHHALQLQLAQLALAHNLLRQRVPERIVGVWQLDGGCDMTLVSVRDRHSCARSAQQLTETGGLHCCLSWMRQPSIDCSTRRLEGDKHLQQRGLASSGTNAELWQHTAHTFLLSASDTLSSPPTVLSSSLACPGTFLSALRAAFCAMLSTQADHCLKSDAEFASSLPQQLAEVARSSSAAG